jgi:hypothetical protein
MEAVPDTSRVVYAGALEYANGQFLYCRDCGSDVRRFFLRVQASVFALEDFGQKEGIGALPKKTTRMGLKKFIISDLACQK